MNYLIYNPLSAGNKGLEIKDKALNDLKNDFDELIVLDGTTINLDEFHNKLKKEDKLIIIGGDGTLNVFANVIKKYNVENELYLYEGGSGNDFLNDIGRHSKLTKLNEYFKHLPVVEVSGEKRYFINNVSFGIDGEVCVEADRLRQLHKENISYTKIAVGLLLGKYKKPHARVLVDGIEYKYGDVWLASALNGQYIGGGMMAAPGQDRMSGYLSSVVFHFKSRLISAIAFPSIFKGTHIKKKHMCKMIKAKRIEVFFDRPTGLQVDGEVYKNVTHYVAYYED